MREIELKGVVDDESAAVSRLTGAGAVLRFAGALADRRYDTPDRAMWARDEVLRLRITREPGGTRGRLDFKGPTTFPGGYKAREEISVDVDAPDVLHEMLTRLGYVVTREIDRDVSVYDLHGARVRLERYPRMDVLVEVEGEPPAIEAAIATLGVPRQSFSSDRLADFVRRYEGRTGVRAAICARELTGDYRYRLDDA
jgi:predicted adenylyl cyclase CyaB